MPSDQKHSAAQRRRLRLAEYDYTSPGFYFVTICTHHRVCLFGNIVNEEMHQNAFGKTVEMCWKEIPTHYPNAALDVFVVMPNHIHGLVVLRESGPPKRGLAEIVRGFKTFSARRINEMRSSAGMPLWQRGYYEHIVRNETALHEIRRYVETNPACWNLDGNNPVIACVEVGLKPAPTFPE